MKILLVGLLLITSSCQVPTLEDAYSSAQNIKKSIQYCPDFTICS